MPEARRISFNVPLRCRCGHVQGVARGVAPSAGFRFICYCKDCQAFARVLERPDLLDAAGGTEIFQMPPGRLRFTAGTDGVRCLHFSSRIFRWYTQCCRTPIANTAGPRVPLVGVILSFMSPDPDGRARDEVFGAPLCRIFEGSAVRPIPANAPPPPSLALHTRRMSKLLTWWIGGLARPNPFFHAETNAPLSVARVVTPSERAALDRSTG